MKKNKSIIPEFCLIVLFVAILTCVVGIVCASAQTVTRTPQGNFISASHSRGSQSHSTGKTYTDSKGVVYPVMVSVHGKYYVVRTSKKTGRKYNMYLKIAPADSAKVNR